MDESLLDFLRSRNVAEDTIEYMINEKIDAGVIILMDGTEEFKQLFPSFGDRMAVMDHCKRKSSAVHKRKLGLVANLKEKINKKKNGDKNETPSSTSSSSASSYPNTQLQRFIELGWLCDVRCMKRKKRQSELEEGLAQVRTKKGGGNRKIKILKTATKEDILKEAKEIFFPNGNSPLGSIDNFVCNLLDFKQCELDDKELTVGDMYALFKNKGTLRFYLSTWKRVYPLTLTQGVSQAASTSTASGASGSRSSPPHFVNTDLLLTEMIELPATFTIPVANEYLDENNEPAEQQLDEEELNPNHFGLEGIPATNDESTVDARPTVIRVHRGQVYSEFLTVFASSCDLEGPLSVEMMNESGEVERAVDTGGVFRDALSEFWSTFYELATDGTAYKVPILRHDMSEIEWVAVARVLTIGWKMQRYFPLKLAPSFMEMCILGTTSNNLREDLLKIVAETEREVIATALKDFNNTDLDELIDALSQFSPKWQPTESNIAQLIYDISHKEIIQKPKFVIDCWSNVLSGLMERYDLDNIYQKNSATSKNIIPLLTTNCVHDCETLKVLGFLKKFVREAKEDTLEHFLRFVTGANVVTGTVTVEFNDETGFKRMPIAHTCASILYLSKKYDNFPDFRSEMNSVLSSKCWVMDIF